MRLTAIYAALFAIVLALAVGNTSAHAATITKTSNPKTTNQSKITQTVKPQQTVVVSPGDNLSELAATYNTTMLRLYYANSNITNPNLIYPGEILVIPDPSENLAVRPLPQEATATSSVSNDVAVSATTNLPSSPPQSATVQPVTENNGIWDQLANCESSGDWSIDTGNGFYGGLQFTLSSWRAVGEVGYPNQASPAQQIAAAEKLQASQGWGAWPVCSEKLGL